MLRPVIRFITRKQKKTTNRPRLEKRSICSTLQFSHFGSLLLILTYRKHGVKEIGRAGFRTPGFSPIECENLRTRSLGYQTACKLCNVMIIWKCFFSLIIIKPIGSLLSMQTRTSPWRAALWFGLSVLRSSTFVPGSSCPDMPFLTM